MTNTLTQFKTWLEKVNQKTQDPDLDYFIEIIEIYEDENKGKNIS